MQMPFTRPDGTPSERRFRQVIDTLQEVVFQTDMERRWAFLNPAWTELTGFPVEECLGRSAMDFIHADDQARTLEVCESLLTKQREFIQHEVRYLTRDGGFRWMDVFVRVTVDEDGVLLGMAGTLNDITERKRTSDALARRERYLTALVDMQQRLLSVHTGGDLYEQALTPLGPASGASRVYIFETHLNAQGALVCSQRAEWCAPGVVPEIDNPLLQELPMRPGLERWVPVLERGEVVTGRVSTFPALEREILQPQGILTLLVLPLRVHGRLVGFVGFDNCFEAREWDRLEVDLLFAASGAISVALERRESERALREREHRFRQLAENASDVLYLYRCAPPRGFTYVSRVAHAKLGLGPEEHYADPELWYRKVHPEDRPALERLLESPRSADSAPVVLRFLLPDGRTLWMEHVVAPVTDAHGRVVAVEGLARDITERRQVEEALKRSEASLRALMEGFPDAAAIERDGHIVYANAVLVTTLGFERAEELVGRRLSEFLADVPGTGVTPLDTTPLTSERRLVLRDGRTRVVELASLPLRFDGQPAVVSIARDVTEQRQLQARLTLADRLASVGTLAAGIAHEINNPLAFVLSNLAFLSDEFRHHLTPAPSRGVRPPDVAEWQEVLGEACEGAERVRQIVRQLKTFSRPDEERVSPVDVHAVLDSVVMMAANEIRHRARLRRDYGTVPLVMANEGRLCQVFLNLVVNAAQAIPEGSAHEHEVVLATRIQGERVVVEVRDTGSGIAPEVMGRIFDPFFTTKPVGVGTGLGLSICHGIISGIGGDISVDSTVGHGSTFRVVLPAPPSSLPSRPEEPLPIHAPASPRGRVLVVDDEPAVGRVLQRLLRGHDVEVATSGRQALERMSQAPAFDAVLCDVMMPDLAGRDVYEAVRRDHPGLERRFVFVSGGAFSVGAREFLAQIPNPLLEKPFDEARVRGAVEDLVRRGPSDAG